MPAIAGEGRALHEAAAAQGIAGIMAASGPARTCPGSEAGSGGSSRRSPAARPPRRRPSWSPRARGRVGPVVALIRRLPLLFEKLIRVGHYRPRAAATYARTPAAGRRAARPAA